MRPQDEIALALPRQDPRGRRFLFRRLRNLPLGPDSMEILSLARVFYSREGSLAAWLTEEAIHARRERERLHRSVGEEVGEVGAWSNLLGASAEADGADATRTACQELAPLVADLEAGAAKGKEHLTFAFRVLGHIRTPGALETITRLAQRFQAVVPAMGALAAHGGEGAAERAVALCRVVEAHPAFAALLEAFGSLPTPHALGYLKTLLPRGGEVTAGVVAALEGFSDFEHLPLIDAAARTGDPWTLINLVETLGRIGSPDHLRRIEAVFDQNPHPLIRIACLQALSATTGEAVLSLASKGLQSADQAVRAAAIEALISAHVPYDQFRDKVVEQLGAQHPKLALNAALACVAVDPERAVAHVTQKLRSGSPADLLQAIQCLAYVEASSSVQGLAQIIQQFPPGAMRLQAVKSLGRLASRLPDATGDLARVLELEDPKARETAAWFLAGVHPGGRTLAAETLAKRARVETSTPASLAAIEALGLLGSAAVLAVPDLHYLLLVGPLQAEAAARALSISFPRSKEAQDLATHGDPAVAGYGGLLRWYDGEGGVELLRGALAEHDTLHFRAGCEVARLAALATSATGETRRLAGLARSLGIETVDPFEVSGLGKLDQSVSIPRRRIGLGVVPRTDTRTAQYAPKRLEVVAPTGSAEETSQVMDEVVRDASYYSAEVPTAERAEDTPGEGDRLDGQLPESPAEEAGGASPSEEPAPAAPPEEHPAPSPPAPAPPPPSSSPPSPSPPTTARPPAPAGATSRLGEIAYWLVVAVLCVLALFAGQTLKRWGG